MDPSDTDWGGWPVDTESADVEGMMDYEEQENGSEDMKMDSQNSLNNNSIEDDDYTYQHFEDYNDSNLTYSDGLSGGEESSEDMPVIKSGNQIYMYPSGKEGMATCERCGTMGIKHAFYSKSKRFCSLSCSRSYATAQREGKPLQLHKNKPELGKFQREFKPHPVKKKLPPKPKPQTNTIPATYSRQNAIKSFDWSSHLNATGSEAAPVSSFKHAAMSDSWDNISVGMKVEVLNRDSDLPNAVFWIATVQKIAGYKALMRYDGFGADSSKDFWLNLCTQDCHPVGWCATIGKPLVPPKTVQYKFVDWKDFLVKRLTGARTLPNNFYNKVLESMSSHKFKIGMQLEVVDKMCVSAMKVCVVDEVIGSRLRLQYVDSQDENDDFWCHTQSPLIHPVGWAASVGHKLHASPVYIKESTNKMLNGTYEPMDCVPDMFPKPKDPPEDLEFKVGMKLEAIDPLNLASICVATVMKVLKNNYLMIGIDGSMAQNGSDWFCYHATSPCIFPVGFCEINGIDLTPPRTYKGPFKWLDYLKQTKSSAAPVKLFDKEIPKHNFKVGSKVEAVDLMEPRLICVGTVSRIVGRLLRIHFDGWESAYDQWVDCQMPDIYPVGWCEMVGYHLEGPKTKESHTPQPVIHQKKRKTKNQIYKGPRKKRKPKLPLLSVNPGREMGRRYMAWDSDTQVENVPPPHIPLAPEAVAANLPPLSGMDTQRSGALSVDTEQHRIEDNGNNSDSQASSGSMPTLSPVGVMTDRRVKTVIPTGNTANTVEIASSGSTVGAGNAVSQSTALPPGIANTGGTVDQNTASPVKGSSAGNTASSKPEGQLISFLTSPTLPKGMNFAQAHTSPKTQNQDGGKDSIFLTDKQQESMPEMWNIFDVCQFLRINNCGSYCDSFSKKNIDGRKFMTLTKEQIVNLTGMKVGPSLKIYDLIQQLKSHVAQSSTPDTESSS